MKISVSEKKEFFIVELVGEFDMDDAQDFQEKVINLCENHNRFIFDLTELKYID